MHKQIACICAIALMNLAATADAQTKFYQCKDQWGQPIFSQRPCGDDAEQGSVKAHSKLSGEDENSASEGAPALARPQSTAPSAEEANASWDKITAARKIRELESEIDRREAKIKRLEKERDVKFARLEDKKRYDKSGTVYLIVSLGLMRGRIR